MKSLKEMQKEAYQIAKEHGFREGKPNPAEKIALIHSEVSEALEALRTDPDPAFFFFRKDGKPEGYRFEMADAVIRIMDECEEYGIDLEEAIRVKMEFNRSRPFKHGKQF